MPQPIADQFGSIPMSPNLASSLERACAFAREQSHRTVTLEHLLLAFTEDPDAAAVLQASSMDLLRLGTDVSGYLGRLPEDMRSQGDAEPGPDAELVRVLQAAVQAAQQSRRRQIDGAIVLAAVVGDGKSPAAGLLKTHGLTFEEAIRALQKATAKGAAQPRPNPGPPEAPPQSATPAAPAPDRVPQPASSPMPAQRAEPSGTHDDTRPAAAPQPAPTPPANGRAAGDGAQSVDEILAAARARIQQRSAATGGGAAAAKAEAPPPPAPDPLPPRERTAPPAPAAMDKEPARPAAPEPPPKTPPPAASSPPPTPPSVAASPRPQPSAQASARPAPSWTPPAGGPSPAARPSSAPKGGQSPSQASSQRNILPFPPAAPQRPGEGSSRPPLPGRADGNLPPIRASAGLQVPPPRPAADAGPPNPAAEAQQLAPPRRPGQRTGAHPGQGPLIETIPRRMRIGEPSTAQVRIGRDRVDGLIQLLMRGRGGVQRPEALLTRALTVRLRAPDGGFWIEALSPETQWVETAAGRAQDDHLTWRWNVIPQERGRGRLLLVVTIRTMGHDGIVAETAPPERVIDVAVTGGRFSGFGGRWTGWLLMLVLGAVLGRFGAEVWAVLSAILKRITG